MSSWFKTLFTDVEANVEKLADHIEAEFKALEARVAALESPAIAVPAPAPVAADAAIVEAAPVVPDIAAQGMMPPTA